MAGKFRFGGREGERIALREGGKISQAALLKERDRTVVSTHPLSLSAQGTIVKRYCVYDEHLIAGRDIQNVIVFC